MVWASHLERLAVAAGSVPNPLEDTPKANRLLGAMGCCFQSPFPLEAPRLKEALAHVCAVVLVAGANSFGGGHPEADVFVHVNLHFPSAVKLQSLP